jgi:hypothetical protein
MAMSKAARNHIDRLNQRENERQWKRDAAEEMYEALRAWEHWYAVDSSEFNRDTAQNMGVKALAKAEGRPR